MYTTNQQFSIAANNVSNSIIDILCFVAQLIYNAFMFVFDCAINIFTQICDNHTIIVCVTVFACVYVLAKYRKNK